VQKQNYQKGGKKMKKYLVFAFAMILLLVMSFVEIRAEGKSVIMGHFLQKFSNPIFVCRGECSDIRVECRIDDEYIVATYAPTFETHNKLVKGEKVENIFDNEKEGLRVYVSADETVDKVKAIFYDDDLDGYFDRYEKGIGEFTIWADQLSMDVKHKLQVRYVSLLLKLNKEMGRQINEYFK
jgi:hypothetical protein